MSLTSFKDSAEVRISSILAQATDVTFPSQQDVSPTVPLK